MTSGDRPVPSDILMAWQNYTVPVVCSVALMVSCWMVGHYEFSFLWIILFSVLYVLKTHMWIKRENKRLRLRQVIMQEREAIMAQFAKLDDLPAWVQFPDTERIEWVNKVLQQLWPYIGEYSKTFLREFIEPQVKAQMPAPFKSFKFVHIDMGDMPCRVGGLKVYTNNVGRDRILVDMDVVYAGDAEFTVQTCGFTGGLNQLVLSGKVRCVMMPLLPYPPMIGGISGSFIELPKFDFNLTGMGEFIQLPGLIDAIRSVVNSQIANLCVLPNKIVVPLAPAVDITKLYFPEPDGIIRIKVIEARNLENKDISFLSKDKSDPYCELQVGAQIFKTRTINNNLNPIFNEFFEAVVDQADGQKLRIELFDKDTTGSDEELGRLSIPLELVKKAGVLHRWFHLEGCKHGELHLKVSWFNLSTKKELLAQQTWENEWLTSDKPVHPAMIMIYVDNVSDLPYPKANLEPSPFVEVTLGSSSQRTPVQVKTVNPLFQSKFTFFVKQPEGQELKFTAIDDGTKRLLGELSVPLLSVMGQPNLEMFQQTFHLTHGIHTSPIVLTIRLRAFEPSADESADIFGIGSKAQSYGNASHIERADRNRSNGKNNGDALPAEPGKTVETAGDLFTPENKLNVQNYQSLNVSNPSIAGSNTSYRDGHSFMDKIRRPKQKKTHQETTNNGGELLVNMRYDADKFKLFVDVVAARDLKPIAANGGADPYVKIKLCPVNSSTPKAERKTAVAVGSTNPQFENEFEFDIHSSDLRNYKLQFIVKDDISYGVFHRPPQLGFTEIPLENFDHRKPLVNQWLQLQTGSS
ncbi:hypothetical protein FO519_000348 [Halicephalobus sp. NKZ332]|nr:hypothetical protein FO519_000348 [Halicephalobus sp. NKZ332]